VLFYNRKVNMKMADIKNICRTLPLVGQLGLSIVVPIVLCIVVCNWLINKFGMGTWVYIPGFIFGLGASFMTMYKLYLSEKEKSKRDENAPCAFNEHV